VFYVSPVFFFAVLEQVEFGSALKDVSKSPIFLLAYCLTHPSL
jgi:hypothetical protein